MPNEHMAAEAEERARAICREIGQPESLWQLALPQAYQDMTDEMAETTTRGGGKMAKVEPDELADDVAAALGLSKDEDMLLRVAGVLDDLADALRTVDPDPEALGVLEEPLTDIFTRLATIVRVERLRRRAARLQSSEDGDLLDELVRRGRIHPSRLQRHHRITIRPDGYHMTHPLSCDLSDCPYDHLAAAWDDPPRSPGTYRFPDLHTLERIDPEADG